MKNRNDSKAVSCETVPTQHGKGGCDSSMSSVLLP